MDAKTLRASILQMAIEGKLVPQRDAEPAVEQIGEAPAEVPFDIPEKWKWCFIGNCVNQIRAGGDKPAIFSKDKTADCTIPVIANGEKNLGIVGYTNEGTITQRSLTVSGRGTIGFSVIRTPPFTPIVRLLVVFESPEKHISLEYLQFFLSALKLEGNGSAVKQLTAPMLRQTAIPVPPITEQRRIVTRLNELLPLVDNFGKAQEALAVAQKEFPEKLKASLLQEAIQGKLVPQLDEEPAVEQIGEAPEDVPFAIPEKWKWVQCKDVVTFNPRIQAQDETEASFIPMTAVSAGFASTIDTSAIKPWKQIKNGFSKFSNGDVLFSKITPCFQNRKSVVCKNLSNEIGAGSTEFHVLRPSKKLLADFLLFFLKSPYLIKYGVENLRGTAGQQRFSTADLKTCLFPLPPIEEQRRIVTRLNELLLLVTKLATTTVK